MRRMPDDSVSPPPVPGGRADVVRSWDARADRYLELFRHEWDTKPFDRAVLDSFAAGIGEGGRVLDAGCGPTGHVTEVFTARGLDATGIDLSPRCVALARREKPSCRFEVGDQRDIGAVWAGRLDGLCSYYSLHDQPRSLLPGTLAAWAGALRPGGRLLVVAKEGTADGVRPDPLGSGIPVYWAEFTAGELRRAVTAAGFGTVEATVREAYADEIPTRRVFLTATRGPHPADTATAARGAGGRAG